MLNVVILTGRLTADPELKHTTSDLAVTNFGIAVDRRFARTGEERQTDFINIVAWRNNAEFVCKYFKKGNLIAIEGSIQTRSYDDKDGNKRKVFEVVANNVQFVESKKAANDESSAPSREENPTPSTYSNGSDSDFQVIETDDDLPF